MSQERSQVLYRAVELATPDGARRLGIAAEKPTFIARAVFPYSTKTAIFELGSVAEGDPIVAYPSLTTALIVGGGLEVKYTGFIAVGEAVDECLIEHADPFSDLLARVRKLRVTGFRAFIEEEEVRHGHVREYNHPYEEGFSKLLIEDRYGIAKGRERYAFRVLRNGRIRFKEVTPKSIPMYLRIGYL